jgi:hypothetical protein
MTTNDVVLIGSDGTIARQDPELRAYDQWLLVWVGPEVRDVFTAVAGQMAGQVPAQVPLTVTGEFLFTAPHRVRWWDVQVQPQVRTRGFTGRAGKFTAGPDITGLDQKAHERLLGLEDFSTTLHGVFTADPDPVFGPLPATRQVVITPDGGAPVEGTLLNPKMVVDHGAVAITVNGEVSREFAEQLLSEARKGGNSDPVLHTHIEDVLPDGHPNAWQAVYCTDCGSSLHASNNECMQTWVETGRGPYCLACFSRGTGEVVEDVWGLR